MLKKAGRLDLSIGELHMIEFIAKDKERGKSISEIAQKQDLSLPSVTIAINNLVKKGYVEKVQSAHDRREYHLRPTKKYLEYYNISSNYLKEVMDRVKARFTPEEAVELDRMLQVVGQELMPEVELK